MKSRAKIDKLAHKYALDISKFHKKAETKIDFSNLNKDFYGDIQTNDLTLKTDKKLLNKIKDKTIKEFIYSNKIIPHYWKTNLNYQAEMTNLISKDKKLLSYIGSFPINNKNIDTLPKIRTDYDINKTNNESYESNYEKSKKIFGFKQGRLNLDEVKIILDDYKSTYPIKERLQNLMNAYNINNEEFSKKENNEEEIAQKTSSSKDSNCFSLLKKINPLNKKERIKIQKAFRQNIFTLDSLKQTSNSNNKNMKIKIKKKYEIKNKTIDNSVKSINYYGPRFSFCPSCKSRNLAFYKYMEPNQCLGLINHIKNYRRINDIYANKSTTYNTEIKNQRSTSVPKLSLFIEKDSEMSELEENANKVFF